MIFFLMAGLLVPELFRLVLEEIGSKPKKRGRAARRDRGLSLVALFVAGRALAHARAVALLDSREYRGRRPSKSQLSPTLQPAGLVRRRGDGQRARQRERATRPGSGFDPDLAGVHFQAGRFARSQERRKKRNGHRVLSYARFPLANIEPDGGGFQVRLRDMRFASELPGRRGIIAVIHLNAQSLVIDGHLEFDAPLLN